jgi:hypothetical protein
MKPTFQEGRLWNFYKKRKKTKRVYNALLLPRVRKED